MKKLLLVVLSTFLLLLLFTSCAELIDTKYENVEVVIVDEYYHEGWLQPVFNGKATVLIPYPDVYKITVEYNGIEYTFEDMETYIKYKGKRGHSAIGVLEIRTYDDGTVKYDITELLEVK